MNKEKSSKNKTIDFDVKDGIDYINRCYKFNCNTNIVIDNILNKTVIGDTFEAEEELYNYIYEHGKVIICPVSLLCIEYSLIG